MLEFIRIRCWNYIEGGYYDQSAHTEDSENKGAYLCRS